MAPPRSLYKSKTNSDHVNQRKLEDKTKDKIKKDKDALPQWNWEESLNFIPCSQSDSEDDPDPVEKPDEKPKEESDKAKNVEIFEVATKILPSKVAEMRQARFPRRPVAPEKKDQPQVKGQNESTNAAVGRLNDVELEKKRSAQAEAQLNRSQPQVIGNSNAQSRPLQSMPEREEARSLEQEVAMCGLCNFPTQFSLTQDLIAHVKKAHERSIGNLPTIRHRMAPAKNIQGDDSQPVVDEEVARNNTNAVANTLFFLFTIQGGSSGYE